MGAFFDSFLKDNKKLTEETKRMHYDKHKVTGKDENKTTNISENQEIKNIKAAHAEEVKSLTIVLEEVGKQLELEKKNTIKLEEKHKTELKDLREKLQDIQFLVGKDKSKED